MVILCAGSTILCGVTWRSLRRKLNRIWLRMLRLIILLQPSLSIRLADLGTQRISMEIPMTEKRWIVFVCVEKMDFVFCFGGMGQD